MYWLVEEQWQSMPFFLVDDGAGWKEPEIVTGCGKLTVVGLKALHQLIYHNGPIVAERCGGIMLSLW